MFGVDDILSKSLNSSTIFCLIWGEGSTDLIENDEY